MKPAIGVFWQRYGLAAVLGLAGAGFLGVIGYETGWLQAVRLPAPAATGSPRTPDTLATLPAFALPSLDSAFKETADRPLFTQSRRPAAVTLSGAAAMKKGQFKLTGTSVNQELTVAFLVETATGKTVRVTKGKEINGMTLDAVEASRVVLKLGEETEELTLRTAASPAAPPKGAAPPPAAMPAGPAPPVVAPPVASVAVGATPPPPQPPARLRATPGSAVLPGFILQAPGSPAPAQAAPSEDTSNTAQRRRRFQPPPPQ